MPRHSEDLPQQLVSWWFRGWQPPTSSRYPQRFAGKSGHSLDSDYIKNVLATEIVGMVAFDLTTHLIILLLAFQSLDQCLGQENALVCRHLFQRSQPLLHGRKVMA